MVAVSEKWPDQPPYVQYKYTPRMPWVLTVLNAMTAVWMMTAGDWLDRQDGAPRDDHPRRPSPDRALAIDGRLRPACRIGDGDRRFHRVGRPQLILLAAAGVVSTVAAAGVLAVLGSTVAVLLTIAVVSRAIRR